MKKTIKELKDRWTAKSPLFWRKALSIAVKLGSSAAAVIGADKLFDLQSYGIPQIIFTICGYIIVACATLGLSAKITKE